MSRLFIIYLIFIILYSFLKGKKREEEKRKIDTKGEASPLPEEREFKLDEDLEEERDIFSLPIEEEQEEQPPSPPPSVLPPRKVLSRREKGAPISLQDTESGTRFEVGNLKRGIILSEILGPPRSRRPYLPPYRRRS